MTQTNRTLRLVFTALFALLGVLRLSDFAGDGQPVDLLSGTGFLLLALGYYHTGSMVPPKQAQATGRGATWRYVAIAGTVMVVAALLMRLVG